MIDYKFEEYRCYIFILKGYDFDFKVIFIFIFVCFLVKFFLQIIFDVELKLLDK